MIAAVLVLGGNRARGAEADVFAAPSAAYAEPLRSAPLKDGDVLRVLNVEERAGVARHHALVRAPVFFGPGECATLEQLAIVPASGEVVGQALVWQADDVRRGPDGGIARAHLWFETDIQPGEKRRYRLVRRTGGRTSPAEAVKVSDANATLRIETAAGPCVFGGDGGVRSVPGPAGAWTFPGDGLRPHVVVGYAATKTDTARRVELGGPGGKPEVLWGAGPLFAKIQTIYRDASGASLEQTYRIPRDGAELVVTTALFPGNGGELKQNELLAGTWSLSPAAQLVRVPAGLRYSLRAEHAYTVSGVPGTDAVLLAVPLVIGGTNGQWQQGGDRLVLEGQGGLQRGGEGEKETLYAYWTEVRLVPAAMKTPTEAWLAYRAHVQPLVAVVEEPGASVDELHEALSDLMKEMKPIGWRQEAGRYLAWGDTARLAKLLGTVSVAKEGEVDGLLRSAENDTAKLTQNGKRRLREDEKGRAYGRIDPYHVTYTQSAAAAVAAFFDAPPAVTTVNFAMAKAVREFGGRADPAGFPYIDCFNRALNMQMGPMLFGLTAGAKHGDDALVRFYRDLATSPPVLAVFGRGQRPYTGAPTVSADQTDYLYQSICDFWLRTAELLGHENLQLHPLAYSRYTDCVDVMADRYHGVAAKDKPGAAGEVRANFYRGQVHTHRWLGWSASPYIRLLEDPASREGVGLTEAIHYTRTLRGRWKNWPDLTFYELADLLVRRRDNRAVLPPPLPLAGAVAVKREPNGAELSWTPVPGAAEYRVYRAEREGGPYTWVNSPYAVSAAPKLTEARWHDANAKPGAAYVVIAVDAAGKPAPWPASP